MSIRRKTLLVTILAVVGAAIAVYISTRLILSRGFSHIESSLISNSNARIQGALDFELQSLDTVTADWANWDDSYTFVQDGNRNYMEVNLNSESLTILGLEFIVFVRPSGEVTYSRLVKADGGKEEWNNFPLTLILKRCLAGEKVKGFFLTSRGISLVSAAPIHTSKKTGPPAGMLVMARRLTPEVVNGLSKRTLIDVQFYPLHAKPLPSDCKAASEALLSNEEVQPLVRPLSRDLIASYAILEDINGNPAVIVRTAENREIKQHGERVMLYLSLSLLAAMTLFGVAVNWLLQRFVTSRLSALTTSVQGIAARKDASARVAVEGEDELASLAASLNTMLSALEQSQQVVKENEARLKIVLDSVQTGILIIDAETHEIIEVNAAALEMCGVQREEIVGFYCDNRICQSKTGKCPITDLGKEVDTSERVLLTKGGKSIPILRRAVEVLLGGRRCILESFIDITDRKKAEDAIRYQAFHDTLTGLPNRRHFQDNLREALLRSHHQGCMVSVLMLDVDRFKSVNDTLGHAAGDKLLKAVAGRLSNCLREHDAVARFGGDEFALLLTDIQDVEGTSRIAHRVLEVLKAPFNIDGFELHTTASLGVSVFPRDGSSVEELLQHADVALYYSKDQGRNTFRHYAAWIDASARARLSLENDLRRALERNEFVIHYQPQIHVPTGKIIGFEALLRWQHPDMGLLLPGEFIPLAEETGLIEPIGEWVLLEACKQNRSWQEAGFEPVRMAVNLSPSQFRQKRLTRAVAQALRDSNLDPAWLELEITETAVMANVSYAVQLMARLKENGVRLCLDDFGIGHASLRYLKQFPVNTIKVDGSFLRTVESNPTDAAIVSAIIGIGESMNLQVIGEAVETPSQLQFLRERGCDIMQGFLFSQAVNANAATELIRQNKVIREAALV